MREGSLSQCWQHQQRADGHTVVRGFAGLLHAGLNGATPTAIAATPDDLCQQLGLQQAPGALRVRDLTALLRRMKRSARDVASAV